MALKLALLSNSPGPNQADFFDALAGQSGLDVTVFYCATSNAKWRGSDGRHLRHNAHYMFNCNPWPRTREYLHLNPVGPFVAASKQYDLVMIHGYSYPTAIAAMCACAVLERPFVFWGEMIDRTPRHALQILKNTFVWPLLRHARLIMTMGQSGMQSYEAIGIPRDRLIEVPYSCDLAPYLSVTPSGDAERRRRIITTTQLIPRKRVDRTIAAFACLAAEAEEWDLLICGDGELRLALEGSIPADLRRRVTFLGFVPKHEQPALYATSDVFLLTSNQDGWGMVVPEAMAASLPVICTGSVESARALITNGLNGFVVDSGDNDGLIRYLRLLQKSATLRRQIGDAARVRAGDFDSQAVAAHAAEALSMIGCHGRR